MIPKYLITALQELGVTEYLDGSNSRILEYFAMTSYPKEEITDEIPWCAAFLCWCLERSGIKSTRSAWSLSFLKWGREIEDVQFGSVVVLTRTEDPSKGHVGIVVGFDPLSIWVLGGNQSNSVCVQKFPRTSVMSYRVPKAS